MKYILTLFIVFLGTQLWAQHDLYQWSLGGKLGLLNFDRNQVLNMPSDFSMRSRSLTLYRRVNQTLMVGAEVLRGETEHQSVKHALDHVRLNLHLHSDNELLLDARSFMAPYLGAGVGFQRIELDRDGLTNTERQFFLGAEVGVKFRWNDRFSSKLAVESQRAISNYEGGMLGNEGYYTQVSLSVSCHFHRRKSKMGTAPVYFRSDIPYISDSLAQDSLAFEDYEIDQAGTAEKGEQDLPGRDLRMQYKDGYWVISLEEGEPMNVMIDEGMLEREKGREGYDAQKSKTDEVFGNSTADREQLEAQEQQMQGLQRQLDSMRLAMEQMGKALDRAQREAIQNEGRVERTRNTVVAPVPVPANTNPRADTLSDSVYVLNPSVFGADSSLLAKDSLILQQMDNLSTENRALRSEMQALQQQVAAAVQKMESNEGTTEAPAVQQQKPKVDKKKWVINYATNAYKVPLSQMGVIEQIVDALRQHPEWIVSVTGYTDQQGNSEYNERLSKRRTDAVKSALMQRGVGEKRIFSMGLGERYSGNEVSQQERKVEVELFLDLRTFEGNE